MSGWYDPVDRKRLCVVPIERKLDGLSGWKQMYFVDYGRSVGGPIVDQTGLDRILVGKVPYTGIDQPDRLEELELNAAVAAVRAGVNPFK